MDINVKRILMERINKNHQSKRELQADIGICNENINNWKYKCKNYEIEIKTLDDISKSIEETLNQGEKQ